MFKLISTSKQSKARRGRLKTGHGVLETPFFMPVATQATIKYASSEDIRRLGSKILLSNTYHLMLRPGAEQVAEAAVQGRDEPMRGLEVATMPDSERMSGRGW